MASVHHKHPLREQRHSIKAKADDYLENKLGLCYVLPNNETSPRSLSLSLTSSFTESILRHNIPSPTLNFDHEMSQWSRHQPTSKRLSYAESLASIDNLRPSSETMDQHQTSWTKGTHQPKTVNRAGKGPYKRTTCGEPLRPPPLDLKRCNGAATSVKCLMSQDDVDQERNRVNLEDFHFNFASTTQSEPDMRSSQSSHSPLPSLSYSNTSSPPATPPMQSDSLSSSSTETGDRPSPCNKKLPLTPPSSPPQVSPPPPDLTPSTATVIQCGRPNDPEAVHAERHAYRPFPTDPGPSAPRKDSELHSSVETSFIEWDETPSRFAKMKKSIQDLRNISSRFTTPPSPTITEPSIMYTKASSLNRMKDYLGKVVGKGDDLHEDQP